MSAFLFTGWASVFDPQRGLADSCSNVILHGCDEAVARSRFEEGLKHGGRTEGEHPRKIEKIVASPILDRLFTETGDEALNWSAIEEQAGQALNAGEEAYEQQGYWADANELVPPTPLAFDLHQLQQSLPDEVRSGLNWSGEAQNYFLVSALVIPSTVEAEPDYENPDALAEESVNHPREAPFPELAEREVTAVVKARNTLVAAWLWRRYAAQTPLACNPIRVDGWCPVAGPDSKGA